MYKIIYLPTAELVKISSFYYSKSPLNLREIMEDKNYSFIKLTSGRIGVCNRTPARGYVVPAIPKYLFEIIEVPDV